MTFRTAILATALVASPAAAQPRAEQRVQQGSPILDRVTQCQGIAEATQRLACYDASVAQLKSATEQRDVVILDKNQVQRTRRSLFGFALPDLPNIFGGGDDDAAAAQPEFTRLESEIVNIRSQLPGRWIMVLANGATWQFAETNRRIEPKRGDKILIKRAALGSYLANIDGQNAVRVQRIG